MLEFTTLNAFMLALGSIIGGTILLIQGGNWTIDSAVYIARRFGISPMIVGFTIVAFGTSFPELVVSVIANMQGSPGIAIGNVLGSNIANILLVIGTASIFAPLMTKAKDVLKDLLVMMGATLLLLALLLHGQIGATAGITMVGLLAAYVFFQYLMTVKGLRSTTTEDEDLIEFSNKLIPYIMLLAGLVFIALGAEFLVRGAKVSASVIGVPDAVIALSIIALGTSLPELSTSIIAARKGHSDIIIGNIVGSNVFNILMIIGITALVKPIEAGTFAVQLVNFDIWLVLAISTLFSALLLFWKRITKPIGIIFLSAYILYNLYIYAIYMTPS